MKLCNDQLWYTYISEGMHIIGLKDSLVEFKYIDLNDSNFINVPRNFSAFAFKSCRNARNQMKKKVILFFKQFSN